MLHFHIKKQEQMRLGNWSTWSIRKQYTWLAIHSLAKGSQMSVNYFFTL